MFCSFVLSNTENRHESSMKCFIEFSNSLGVVSAKHFYPCTAVLWLTYVWHFSFLCEIISVVEMLMGGSIICRSSVSVFITKTVFERANIDMVQWIKNS